jgi:hypothetical protein
VSRLSTAGAAAVGLAALALFSALFSIGHVVGLWTAAAPASLARLDLAAGFVVGAVLLVSLLRRGRS